MKPAISIERLGKKYQLNHKVGDQEYPSLRGDLTRAMTAPWRWITKQNRPQRETFWALRGVSFDVEQGEVVGIIGHNGAGKSTLLKILSRITWPTEGQARTVGRVASLLEVGTGFHPELTGRENILLNGSILGMSRKEILLRFDEIVSFGEVSQFIDTPVKRYSSGMYLRLAFAVAAHLDPEILIVDEVLAVGDAQFQRRCLAKMQQVVQANRTVLFVSHNLQAVQSLCQRVYLLEKGRVVASGEPSRIIAKYLSRGETAAAEISWPPDGAPGDAEFRLVRMSVSSESGVIGTVYPSSASILIGMTFEATGVSPALCVGFELVAADGSTVLTTYQTDLPENEWPILTQGVNTLNCRIPARLLNRGQYFLSPRVKLHTTSFWKVKVDSVLQFEIVLDHGDSPAWSSQAMQRFGHIAPILRWDAPLAQPRKPASLLDGETA